AQARGTDALSPDMAPLADYDAMMEGSAPPWEKLAGAVRFGAAHDPTGRAPFVAGALPLAGDVAAQGFDAIAAAEARRQQQPELYPWEHAVQGLGLPLAWSNWTRPLRALPGA